MAIVSFNRTEIEKHFKLDAGALDKINLFGTPVEKCTPESLDLEILANRPDLLSMQGFIRAFKAFIGKEPGLKQYKLNKTDEYVVTVDPSVQAVRPYTVCAVVKGLKLTDEKIKEIIEAQEKLHTTIGRNRKKMALGVYPLDKIRFPIMYEARKPSEIKFRPLDSDHELSAQQILERHPVGIAYAKLLTHAQKYPLFSDAAKKILSMPPIINSHETGRVTTATTDVFVECSGSDSATLQKTLAIIVTMLADMGGKIYTVQVHYRKGETLVTPDLSPQKMKLDIQAINQKLGLDIKEKELTHLASLMGLEYLAKTVKIPAWRTDVLSEVDIIEDIAIAYGYDRLLPLKHNAATIGAESPYTRVSEKIAETLTGLGFLEVSSYHLIKEEEAKKLKIEKKLEVENSKTEYKVLRPSLIAPILRILSENKDAEYPQSIFELGTVFEKGNTQTGIKEKKELVVAASPANATHIKQVWEYLSKTFQVNAEVEKRVQEGFIQGRTVTLKHKDKEIGFLGELHPEMLQAWNIKMPVAILLVSLDDFMASRHPK